MKSDAVVVFDLGKVLVDFDFLSVPRRLAPYCHVNQDALGPIIGSDSGSSLLARYETGALTTEQFFREAQALSGFTGSLEGFGEIFGNIFTPITEMVALLEQVRTHGYPTYIFSNTNELAVHYISRFPFFKLFDDYILSYEHGALKPDPPLYEVVETTSGKTGSQLVYIDDRPENVETALARGWRAVRHQDPESTSKQLGQWLNL